MILIGSDYIPNENPETANKPPVKKSPRAKKSIVEVVEEPNPAKTRTQKTAKSESVTETVVEPVTEPVKKTTSSRAKKKESSSLGSEIPDGGVLEIKQLEQPAPPQEKEAKSEEAVGGATPKKTARARKSAAKGEEAAPQPEVVSTVEPEDLPVLPLNFHPEVNIGTAGHVDEGKSTLVQALTGKFPDSHSEEIKRGITIRLGYADCDIYECPQCPEPAKWNQQAKCRSCGGLAVHRRRVSFVDAPGHEILMQVMLSGAAIMDGVILVVGANRSVPQPQTREHLAAITALGIHNVIIVQNKVELVSEAKAKQNYKDIKNFLKGTIAENAPVIPMSAIHGINVDLLLSAIQNFIPSPKRDADAPLRMFAARTFDINRPGTLPMDMKGGVFGGSIKSGQVKVGDKIVIQPGLKKKVGKAIERIQVTTQVVSIRVGSDVVSDVATPGGLVAIQTALDSSMTRSDNLSGCVLTTPGNELPIVDRLSLKYTLFPSVVGSDTNEEVKPLMKNEALLMTIGTDTMTGVIEDLGKGIAKVKLTGVVALDASVKVALSRNIQKRWRLIGFAEIV